jgi:hypothetical protein
MTYRFRSLFSPIAAMTAIVAMGMAVPARADLEIWASTTNNPPVAADKIAMGTSGTSATFSGMIGTDVITVLATSSNSPGSPTLSKLVGTDLDITNTGSSTQTVYITLGDTGFTSPVAPPSVQLLSHIGGTVVVGDSDNALTYWSYVNNGPAGGQNSTAGLTPGAQMPDVTATGSFRNDLSLLLSSLTSGYSLTERFAITLGAGQDINFASSTTLQSVPEPSTLVLAGLGALGMVGYGLRRRKARGA